MKLGVAISLGIPLAIWKAYVASWVWLWFFVPLGLIPIGVAWMVGILATIQLAVTGAADYRAVASGNDTPAAIQQAVYGFVYPALTLIVGWIAQEIAF